MVELAHNETDRRNPISYTESAPEKDLLKGARMINKSKNRIIVCVLVACLLTFAGYTHGERDDITMAILPCTDVVMTFKKFHPLVSHL